MLLLKELNGSKSGQDRLFCVLIKFIGPEESSKQLKNTNRVVSMISLTLLEMTSMILSN